MNTQNEENRAEALESIGRGTCDHCGEEFPMTDLISVSKCEWVCNTCKAGYQQTNPDVRVVRFRILG